MQLSHSVSSLVAIPEAVGTAVPCVTPSQGACVIAGFSQGRPERGSMTRASRRTFRVTQDLAYLISQESGLLVGVAAVCASGRRA